MTVNGCAPIVTVWPTGLWPPNSSEAVVAPSTTSGCTVVSSDSVNIRPVATVRAREAFTRSDPRVLLDLIDLGTTVSEVRVDAAYRFHIAMAKAWPLRIVGKTCLVQAGAVEPTLPVAFDSRTIQRRTASGWARFDKRENLQALERSLTQLLAERAPLYRERAREAGRAIVAEFVAEWLLREQQWRRDPEHRVVVVFDDEPGPEARAASEPSYLKGIHVPEQSATQRPDNNKSLWRH